MAQQYTGIADIVTQTTLSKDLIEYTKKECILRQLAVKKEQLGKKKGDTVQWAVVGSNDQIVNKFSEKILTEKDPVPNIPFYIDEFKLKVTEVGSAIEYTGKLEELSSVAAKPLMDKSINYDAKKFFEMACLMELEKTPWRYIAQSETEGITLGHDVFSLKRQNWKEFADKVTAQGTLRDMAEEYCNSLGIYEGSLAIDNDKMTKIDVGALPAREFDSIPGAMLDQDIPMAGGTFREPVVQRSILAPYEHWGFEADAQPGDKKWFWSLIATVAAVIRSRGFARDAAAFACNNISLSSEPFKEVQVNKDGSKAGNIKGILPYLRYGGLPISATGELVRKTLPIRLGYNDSSALNTTHLANMLAVLKANDVPGVNETANTGKVLGGDYVLFAEPSVITKLRSEIVKTHGNAAIEMSKARLYGEQGRWMDIRLVSVPMLDMYVANDLFPIKEKGKDVAYNSMHYLAHPQLYCGSYIPSYFHKKILINTFKLVEKAETPKDGIDFRSVMSSIQVIGPTKSVGSAFLCGGNTIKEIVAVPEQVRIDPARDLGRNHRFGWYAISAIGTEFGYNGCSQAPVPPENVYYLDSDNRNKFSNPTSYTKKGTNYTDSEVSEFRKLPYNWAQGRCVKWDSGPMVFTNPKPICIDQWKAEDKKKPA